MQKMNAGQSKLTNASFALAIVARWTVTPVPLRKHQPAMAAPNAWKRNNDRAGPRSALRTSGLRTLLVRPLRDCHWSFGATLNPVLRRTMRNPKLAMLSHA